MIVVALALLARAIPAFAFCGDVRVDFNEQCDVIAQAGEAACPGACIPPGVSGACTCAVPSKNVKDFAAIADTRLRLGTSASVLFGGVAVTQPSGSLSVGRRVFMASSSQAIGDRARVIATAELGRLFANVDAVSPDAVLANGGPFTFPPPLVITGLPPFPAINPGGTDVTVPPDTSLALAPGAYGRVFVGDGAILVLVGVSPGSGTGTYQLAALRIDGDGRIEAHNPVVVNVAERLGIGGGSFLGPASFAAAIAGDIQVNVGGRSARVKQGGTLIAHLRVPVGGISLGRGAIATGLVVGKTISAADNALITRQGSCGDGTFEPGEECDASASGGDSTCPGQCIPVGQRGQCGCRCTSNAQCTDGNACNGTETCDAGVCTRSLPPSCNDGNPCTRDCDPAIGCVNTPVTNGASCSDGSLCTTQDTCQGGTCTGGPARNCDDQNTCTDDDCGPAAGCTHAPLANGTACTDANACTLVDVCVSGICTSSGSPNCFDDNPCTDDTCQPVGGCTHPPLPNGATCADTNACTAPDSCQNGACSGPPANCDDTDPCSADTCDAQLGCMHTTLPNGTPCAPGKTCVSGSCL